MKRKKQVDPDITLARAHLLMKLFELDHLPVYEKENFLGIIKSIDVQKALHEKLGVGREKVVREYMSSLVEHYNGNTSVFHIVQAFLERPIEAVALTATEGRTSTLTKTGLLQLIIQNKKISETLLKEEVSQFLKLEKI